jgi:hypothetical protein
MKKNETRQKPFFAAFLENQLKAQQSQHVQGGDGPVVTGALSDQAQTMKYPSDQEDNPGTTNPDWDCVLTMKYPSDNDEDNEI